ncbi:MAG: hypothetical protein IRZ08_02335 [Frankia sp.]|nr:hypothetical protein [Frankia sp.]
MTEPAEYDDIGDDTYDDAPSAPPYDDDAFLDEEPDGGFGGRASVRMGGVDGTIQATAVIGGENRGLVQERGNQSSTTVSGDVGTVVNQPSVIAIFSEQENTALYSVLGLTRQGIVRTRDGRWMRHRFVPPDGFGKAVAVLRRKRVVLLTGQPGSGRSTAAMMALLSAASAGRSTVGPGAGETRGGRTGGGEAVGRAFSADRFSVGRAPGAGEPAEAAEGTIRDLTPFEEAGEGRGSWLRPDEIQPGDRLRLDLSRATEILRDGDTERLLDLVGAVRSRTAWLAVVVSEGLLRALPSELSDYHVSLGRPATAAVLASYLRADGLDRPQPELEAEIRGIDQASRLDALSMELIARIAQGAPRPADGRLPEPLPQWLPAAIQAALGDEVRLFHEFARQTKPDREDETAWRIRVACVAMLEGASVPMITFAERELVRLCGPASSPEQETHPFERPELEAWLKSADAVRVGNPAARHSQVQFARPAYGIAARRYFWTQHPHLADVYLAWFDRLAREASGRGPAGQAVTTLLAARIAEQMLATAAVDELLWLSRRWMRVSDRAYIKAAVMVLRLGLEDDAGGEQVRQAFYQWSRASVLPANWAVAVIGLCVNPLAVNHPYAAVTRLLHFLGHTREDVGATAVKALVDLADREDRHRLVLGRVLRLLADAPPVRDTVADGGDRQQLSRQERRYRQATKVFLKLAAVDRLTRGYPEIIKGSSDTGVGPPDNGSVPTRGPEPTWTLAETSRAELAGAWRVALERSDDREALTVRLADWLAAAAGASALEQLLDILVAACGRRLMLQNRLADLALAATRVPTAMIPTPVSPSVRYQAYLRLLNRIVHGDEPASDAVPTWLGWDPDGETVEGMAEK